MPSTGTSGESLREEALKQSKQWLEEKNSSDLWMESHDGLMLHATQVQNETPSDRWVILCHGYLSRGIQMVRFATTYYEQGYNILLPDCRGHGESEGDYIGMGWPDRLDMVQWIETITANDPGAQIVLHGISMGGATVMMTAGEDLPDNVKAIVEDCGYSSVWDEFAHQLNGVFHLPTFPIMQFSSVVTKIRAGYTLGEASAIKQVEKSKTPILFIHGDEDTFVPAWMLDKVYDVCDAPKEKLLIEGAGHGQASAVAPELYWGTVWTFIDRYVTTGE